MPSIGSIVRVGVVVAAAAASSATSYICETEVWIERGDFTVLADDPEHREALQACLEQDARCEQLCDDLLGAPRPGTTRSIRECYLVAQGNGYRVHTEYEVTQPCESDWELYPDAAWSPDAAHYPDAAPEPDTLPAPDATPPDAAP